MITFDHKPPTINQLLAECDTRDAIARVLNAGEAAVFVRHLIDTGNSDTAHEFIKDWAFNDSEVTQVKQDDGRIAYYPDGQHPDDGDTPLFIA
ncbi:hypothetical protein [Microbacterium sp. NPDC055455]